MLRLRFIVFVILILAVPGRVAAHTPGTVIQELEISLDPAVHRLVGKTVISSLPGRMILGLNPEASVIGASVGGTILPFTFRAGLLEMEVPDEGGPSSVTVRWECLFHDEVRDKYSTGEDPTYGINGTIAPEGVFLGDHAAWYPRLPHPPSRLTITVSAPAGMVAVTVGRRVAHVTEKGRTLSIWECTEPVRSVPLSAGPYVVAERNENGIPIYTYLRRENADLSERYLSAAARHLSRFQKRFGRYPFSKFAVVENFFPTGYGFPSYTLIGGNVLRLPFLTETSLPHEIAHNWWGNGVETDPDQGNWSEGLVTYLADYEQEAAQSAERAADYRFRILTQFSSVVTPGTDFPLDSFSSRSDPVTQAVGYGKGAMVFHMIETMLGRDAFDRALRAVLSRRLFRTASWSDLIVAFSEAAGKDIAPFVNQWLHRVAGPKPVLTKVTLEPGDGWNIRGFIEQPAPPFRFGTLLRVENTDGGSRDFAIEVSGEKTPFSLLSDRMPRRLRLDPEFHLFRLLDPDQMPPTINLLKSSRSLAVIRADDCRADPAAIGRLLAALGQDSAPVHDENRLREADLAGRDLLYCGLPARPDLFGPLPEGIAVREDGFTVGRERFITGDSSLFLTLKVGRGKRTAALFLPLSPDAAHDAVGRIAHYGKFSYLVFTGGKNRLKGTFPANTGRDTVEFLPLPQ